MLRHPLLDQLKTILYRAAAYWSASIDGQTIKDIAWCVSVEAWYSSYPGTRSLMMLVCCRSYPHPKDAAKNIAGYYAFDKVRISMNSTWLCPLIALQKQVKVEA